MFNIVLFAVGYLACFTQADVKVVPVSSTQMNASWTAPLSDGGSPISKYLVEWDTKSGIQEQQTITSSGVTGGKFSLTFRGQRTTDLGFEASELQVQKALEALPTAGAVTVSRSGPNQDGYSWVVTFATNVGNVPLMTARSANLIGANKGLTVSELVKGTTPSFDQGTVGVNVLPLGSTTVTRLNEVQTITVSTDAADLSGSFLVEFMGETSISIPHDATVEQMTTSLQGLSTIGTISVTAKDLTQSTVPPLVRHGRSWTITFLTQEGDLPSMLVKTTSNLIAMTSANGGTLKGTTASVAVKEVSKGDLPMHYVIDGLTKNTPYFVRVSAFSSRGWGKAQIATFSANAVNQAPSSPVEVSVSVASSSKLFISRDRKSVV